MRTLYHPKLVAAARELCKIRGEYPDEFWTHAAEEIVHHLEIRKAMMAVGVHGLDQVPESVADEPAPVEEWA